MLTSQKRMARVRVLTWLLSAAVFVFLGLWIAQAATWLFPVVFGAGLQSSHWIDDGVTVLFVQKALIFSFWVLIIGLAINCAFAAGRLLGSFRKGAFFAVTTCQELQKLGAGLTVLMIVDTVYSMVWPAILTMANPVDGAVGKHSVAYFYDAGDITIALCGLGFFLIGWVLAEGAAIEAENKAII